MTEQHLGLFLVQVLLLLALARGLGEVLRRLGHPPLVGEIAIGLLLGPTLLGRAWPALQSALFPPDPIQLAMLDTVAWFGVLFLLLETGLEVDVSAAWRQRGPALRIGVIGVLVPLAFGFGFSLLLPDRYMPDPSVRLPFALFLGTTMAISAMVIIARVLHDLDLVKSDLGLVTLCGYAVNDILAWVILAVVLGMATPIGVRLGSVALSLIVAIAFTAFCLTWGLRGVDRAIAYVSERLPDQPGAVLSLVSCVGLACGALTQRVGLTALFGFFLAGIMAGESHALSERTRNVVSQMVHSVFVPLYFAGIGLQYDFLAEFDWFIVTFVTVISIAAKFGGARLGAIGTALSREDRLSIGIAFTPSGVTGIVAADLALEHGILTTEVFVGIVVSAIVSSLLVAPWLSWSIHRRKAVNVLAFFARSAAVPDLRGTTRWEVIDELCGSLAGHAGTPAAGICYAAVRQREELQGTGTGGGVAIPHARLPSLRRPVLAFGRSVAGVEWDAPDGLPVHLVFLLLSPEREGGLQLQILAALASGLAEAAVRERLIRAGSDAETLAALDAALRSQHITRVTSAPVDTGQAAP
ncbi:MAG: PTS transporter subunit EIIA [Gemmatimonadetes bacterium]|nr:PTS transporter subunit EIIA [Gemmatimonadota bacterium]NIO31508.1 PTS transporter subunit EIIA [Gemmatimonadota bacterium]